jgi:hypothetical protein
VPQNIIQLLMDKRRKKRKLQKMLKPSLKLKLRKLMLYKLIKLQDLLIYQLICKNQLELLLINHKKVNMDQTKDHGIMLQ